MARILIKGGRVFDGERFFDADVLTDGEMISEIAPKIACGDATYVYDASGKTVSAGLVDTHVHMRVTPTDRYGIQAEMSCFPFGVTSAADAGRTSGSPETYDSFMLKSVVFVTAHISGGKPDFDGLEESVSRFGKRVVGIKVYFDDTQEELCDLASLSAICGFAKTRGLRVMVHCTNSPAPMSAILNGLNSGDILTHAFHGGKNNASEDGYESIRLARRRGVIIDSGFAGHVHTDFAVLSGAIKAGIIPDTVSTDITKLSAYTRGGRYGMTMCMSIARTVGMREEDIFKAVTSHAAKALGKEDEWGYLKAGRSADIAVFDYTDKGFDLTDKAGNRIKSEKGYRCALTVSDGQIVFKD